MGVIVQYKCEGCDKVHDNRRDAEYCSNSNERPQFKVGDIVELRYGFGWYDGSKDWVINPDVDTKPHGFSENESMGFYYVITYIDMEDHRVRYHAATLAMTGEQGYREGYTYHIHHYTPVLIEAPQKVIDESKYLIGNIAKYMM